MDFDKDMLMWFSLWKNDTRESLIYNYDLDQKVWNISGYKNWKVEKPMAEMPLSTIKCKYGQRSTRKKFYSLKYQVHSLKNSPRTIASELIILLQYHGGRQIIGYRNRRQKGKSLYMQN